MNGAAPAFPPGFAVRPARDDDADGLIRIVAEAYAQYPGCVLDVEGEEPELKAVATAFAGQGGHFWVAERDGAVLGMVGCHPGPDPRAWELKKLYVDTRARRSGLGAALVSLACRTARGRGAVRMELWSDTRFTQAHRLYLRLGFTRLEGTRELHDLSRSVEYAFVRDLASAEGASSPPAC